MSNSQPVRHKHTIVLTAFALIAFAANSVLNRLALGSNVIDASSYVGIRLVSGAVTLWLINSLSKHRFRFAQNLSFEDINLVFWVLFTFLPTVLPFHSPIAASIRAWVHSFCLAQCKPRCYQWQY